MDTEFYGEQFGAPNWGIYGAGQTSQWDDEINQIQQTYMQQQTPPTNNQSQQMNLLIQQLATNPQYRQLLKAVMGIDQSVEQSKWVVWILVAILVVMLADFLMRVRIKWK